jgi:hypothetical protein
VQRFNSDNENLRRLTPDETRRVVTAVCECDEEGRREVAAEAASRAASLVSQKFDDLQRSKDEALRKLEVSLHIRLLRGRSVSHV